MHMCIGALRLDLYMELGLLIMAPPLVVPPVIIVFPEIIVFLGIDLLYAPCVVLLEISRLYAHLVLHVYPAIAVRKFTTVRWSCGFSCLGVI